MRLREVLVLLACAATLAAQETRSMIFGRVLDPQASAVPGATVIVTNVETNTSARCRPTTPAITRPTCCCRAATR